MQVEKCRIAPGITDAKKVELACDRSGWIQPAVFRRAPAIPTRLAGLRGWLGIRILQDEFECVDDEFAEYQVDLVMKVGGAQWRPKFPEHPARIDRVGGFDERQHESILAVHDVPNRRRPAASLGQIRSMGHKTATVAATNFRARDILAREHDQMIAAICICEFLQYANLMPAMTLQPSQHHGP